MKIRTLIIIGIVLIAAAAAYWYFFLYVPAASSLGVLPGGSSSDGGFSPFGRNPSGGSSGGNNQTGTGETDGESLPEAPIPVLRLLSATPVGGYGATTTASTTLVHWIDRGRGNVYEAAGNTLNIATLSNTVVPRIYQSVWNRNATAFIGSLLDSSTDVPTSLYAELKARPGLAASSTASTSPLVETVAPFELKGKNIGGDVIGTAASPKKDRIFMLVKENGRGVGYISNFDGSSAVRIFDTPITQASVDWPEENTIALVTSGSAAQNGFLYFINPKTGAMKRILGPLPGLSAKVSHDAKYVLISATGNSQNIATAIYTVADSSSMDPAIRTLAEKCAWGNFYTSMLYCAVPSQVDSALYPDDWYAGTVSFTDKIWQVNASTGEVKLVSSLIDQADRIIDAFNVGIDAKDGFLFFMNKNDLSLWSLDLIAAE